MINLNNIKFTWILCSIIFYANVSLSANKINEPIYGIVIEEQDGVGKTTLANLIEKKLLKYNISVKRGHVKLTNNPLADFILKEITKLKLPSHANEESAFFHRFNLLRMVQLNLDVSEYNSSLNDKTSFLIQDRYFFSQIIFNELFSKNKLSDEILAFNKNL